MAKIKLNYENASAMLEMLVKMRRQAEDTYQIVKKADMQMEWKVAVAENIRMELAGWEKKLLTEAKLMDEYIKGLREICDGFSSMEKGLSRKSGDMSYTMGKIALLMGIFSNPLIASVAGFEALRRTGKLQEMFGIGKKGEASVMEGTANMAAGTARGTAALDEKQAAESSVAEAVDGRTIGTIEYIEYQERERARIEAEKNQYIVNNYGKRIVIAEDLPQRITYSNADGRAIGYYVSSNGCTWYAMARYNQVNGEGALKFARAGGNANNWINSIDTNVFNVSSTDNPNVIQANTIACSNVSDGGTSGNHVAYVEGVIDGYVYYSEGAYGHAVSTYGYLKRMPLGEFASAYEYIISGK